MQKIMLMLIVMASALIMSACGGEGQGSTSSSQSNPIITNVTNSGDGNVYITNGDGDITECYSLGDGGSACTQEQVVDGVFTPKVEEEA